MELIHIKYSCALAEMNSCENLELNANSHYNETLRMKTQPRHKSGQRDCPSKGSLYTIAS